MGVTNFVDSTKKTPTFINDEITGIKVQYLKIILANLKENNELFVYSNDIEIAYNKKMKTKAIQKIESYQMNDIYQADRLILTFETKQCVLNSKIIENLTARYLFEMI